MNIALFNAIWGLSHKNGLLDAVGVVLAQYMPYLMGIGVVIFILTYHGSLRMRMMLCIEAVITIIVSRGIITEIIRFFYHHPRPFAALGFEPLIPESGYSFPSGHAVAFFAIATMLYLFNKQWGISYFLLSLINGVARIYAGVHWPLDVLGGIFIGMLVAILMHAFLRPYREKLASKAGEVKTTSFG